MPLSSRELSHHAGFWVVTVAFVAAMAYSTVPTPLYPLYEERDGLPVWVITMIFAAYAIGALLALFFVGPLSDWAGRRRVAVIAIVMSVLSAVLFLVWNDVPGLLTARLINGLSIGTLTAAATAHLSELRAIARPAENPVMAAAVAGAANVGGLALGPLIGGLFAEYLPAPLLLPHSVFLALLVIAALLVSRVPETTDYAGPRPRYRPQRLTFPPASRGLFSAAALGAFASFALLGLFSSLAPTFLIEAFHQRSHLLAGATSFAVFACAALAQVLLVRVALRLQLAIALASCVVGLGGIATGALLPSFPAFLLGGMIAGAGVGILFRSAIATASRLAEPGHRGETLALIFFIGYCGLALPAIAVGVSLLFVPEATVLLVFASLVLAATLSAGVVMHRQAVRR